MKLEYVRPAEGDVAARAADFRALMSRRRTVREFASDPIPDGVLEDVVRTAGAAPSGANKQPWFFAVVRDPAVKARIREAAEQEETLSYAERYSQEMLEDIAVLGVNASKPYLTEAPALIVVFKQSYRVVDAYRRKNYYVNESVGLASGLLLAAIHHAGLVTVTHTPSPMKFLNEILERPQSETAILLMPVGFPAADVEIPDVTRKSLDEIARFY